jgi:hypothetical protein
MKRLIDARRILIHVAAVLVTTVFALLSLAMKAACFGIELPIIPAIVRNACYSDIAALWGARDLDTHLAPYSGGYDQVTQQLVPGTLEYPTLSGLVIWITASASSSEVAFLLISAAILGTSAILVTLLLRRISTARSWVWAAAPAVILYTVYNWDVLPVLVSVGAFVLVLRPPGGKLTRWHLIGAGTLLGIGGALKLYPLLFVVPLVLWVLFDASLAPATRRWRQSTSAWVFGAASAVILVTNIPFMLHNFSGWAAAFQFQFARAIDATTLSLWWVTFTPFTDIGVPEVQRLMMTASTASTGVAILGLLAYGWFTGKRRGTVNWIGLAAALLCVYLIFNKVNSPQYVLWLIPFFVILRVRSLYVVAYFVADLATFFGWYLWNTSIGSTAEVWHIILIVGVSIRLALLAVFVIMMPRTLPVSSGERVFQGHRHHTVAARKDEALVR